MSSGDLISLGSLVVAIIAFMVSVFTYHVQKSTQVSSDEQNLNDLIEKIQSGLAATAVPQTTFSLESYAAENTALAALQGQALEARRLARRAEIELDWFKNMVLAYAFSQVWDLGSAKEFWDGAVGGAKTAQARVRSLAARAEFYYNRGLNGDWDLAQQDYEDALDEVRHDADGQGPDLVAEQVSGMKV